MIKERQRKWLTSKNSKDIGVHVPGTGRVSSATGYRMNTNKVNQEVVRRNSNDSIYETSCPYS